MSQKPMYPLSCDLNPENRFDEGMALIHGPDHSAVATVVVQMEGDRGDRPDLLELAERMVLCYNAVPPSLVSTGALRQGRFNAEAAISLACEANRREWLVSEELDALRVELSAAAAEAAISREQVRLLNTLLGFTLVAAGTVVFMVTAVTSYLGFFDQAWALVKGFM